MMAMVSGFFVINHPSNGIQNGPDGVALIDPNGVPIDYFSYEGSFCSHWWSTLLGLNLFSKLDGEESGSSPMGLSLQFDGTSSQGIDLIG